MTSDGFCKMEETKAAAQTTVEINDLEILSQVSVCSELEHRLQRSMSTSHHRYIKKEPLRLIKRSKLTIVRTELGLHISLGALGRANVSSGG